ncbi:hypothetical protein BaRGS_00027979 [Batillaria attramentaria]|uniref:Uncharacterized protein n=1 Tax=Batillaria attramentaria TaxID=370345 RepID=A0ABD0K0X2_9CAEN
MSMLSRSSTLAKKPRKRPAGASRYGTRCSRDHRKRRASAPILSPAQQNFPRMPSPVSRSAETVARLGLSQSPSPQPSSPCKSVSFSTEVEEVFITRPDSLSVPHSSTNPTPPPSEKALYESTVVWADGEDPDQTFSVLGGLCEAGVETSNPCDFIARAFSILGATWPVTVFLVVLLAMPLVMTTIGVNYLHECPVEPKLPIYLVVGGCFGIVKLLFLLWKQIKRHKEDLGDLHDDIDLLTMTRMTNIALNIFHCVWFAFGHYWVFHIWKPHFVAPLHEPRNWCDETVFMFSFWQLIICHVVLAILLALSAVMCCCFVCVKCVIADAKR